MPAQYRVGLGGEPARMTRLADEGAADDGSELREEVVGEARGKSEARRKLDQHRTTLCAKALDLAGETRQQIGAIGEAALMRDGFGKLHREAEPGGHARGPARVGGAPVRTVKARVDLDGVET